MEKELESVGIRLNKHKPNIYFKVRPLYLWTVTQAFVFSLTNRDLLPSFLQPKKGGGISFNSTVTLTQCSEKLVQLILHEYSILPERAGSSLQDRIPGDARNCLQVFFVSLAPSSLALGGCLKNASWLLA